MNKPSEAVCAPFLYREGLTPGPSPATMEWLGRVRALVDGLPVTAWEASCRLSPRGMEFYRLGTGLPPSGLPLPLLDSLKALALPMAVAAQVKRSAAFINHLYLAVEEGPQGVVLKLYLECPVQHSGLLMIGMKWLPGHPEQPVRLTRYTRHVGHTRAELLARLGGVVTDASKVPTPLALATWAIDWVNQRLDLDNKMLPWIDVREDGQYRRQADDLNFYGTGLPIKALAPGLIRLCGAWGLTPDPLREWLQVHQEAPVGHLSVGVREGGEEFLTLYYPVAGLT